LVAEFNNESRVDLGAPIERAEMRLTTQDGHVLTLDLSWPDFIATGVTWTGDTLMISQLMVRQKEKRDG
jgi:hypothetical protein